MGLLQVVTCAVTYWFNISNPNIMMLGSKGILTPLIPNCYVLCRCRAGKGAIPLF